MTQFDFEARHNDRSEEQTETQRKQSEIDDQLKHRVRQLADAIGKYAEGRCEIEISVQQNEVTLTKRMTGYFLKINNILTITVGSEGTFAVGKGDYEKVLGADGRTGSLVETEMVDVVTDWLME